MRKRRTMGSGGISNVSRFRISKGVFRSLMKTRLLRTTGTGVLDPRAYASDSAALMHRKALGSRLQERGVVAVIFSISFLDPLS